MTYHPGLLPLYMQYAEILCNTLFLYVHDPMELQYIAAARWPGFAKPVIWQQDGDYRDEECGTHGPDIQLPNMDGRLRLFKFFSPSFTRALEALYPRLTNASDWASENDFDPTKSLTDGPFEGDSFIAASSTKVENLPRLSKFILIAAFLASTNPARSDMRMFGRGPAERKKRRRRGPSVKNGSNKTSAVRCFHIAGSCVHIDSVFCRSPNGSSALQLSLLTGCWQFWECCWRNTTLRRGPMTPGLSFQANTQTWRPVESTFTLL